MRVRRRRLLPADFRADKAADPRANKAADTGSFKAADPRADCAPVVCSDGETDDYPHGATHDRAYAAANCRTNASAVVDTDLSADAAAHRPANVGTISCADVGTVVGSNREAIPRANRPAVVVPDATTDDRSFPSAVAYADTVADYFALAAPDARAFARANAAANFRTVRTGNNCVVLLPHGVSSLGFHRDHGNGHQENPCADHQGSFEHVRSHGDDCKWRRMWLS